MNLSNLGNWPIILPIKRLLSSRKFMLALASLLVSATAGLPQADVARGVIVVVITLIGGITAEDIFTRLAENRSANQSLADLANEAVKAEFPASVAAAFPLLTPELFEQLRLYFSGNATAASFDAATLKVIQQYANATTPPDWIVKARAATPANPT